MTGLGSDGVMAPTAILFAIGPDSFMWFASLIYFLRCPALTSFSTRNFRLRHLLIPMILASQGSISVLKDLFGLVKAI